MADVTARMLALLSTLQTGRSLSGNELAQRLGISLRTLRRDIERLRGYGYPVDSQPGPGGHYRLAAGRTMPPLLLDDDETIATLLGLAALAATGPARDGDLNQAATQAYGKLDQFLPARLHPKVASLRASLETSSQDAPPVSAEQLGLIGEAIAHRDIVRFDYTNSQGDRTSRRVEPYRQVHHLLRWYLLAWDLHREDWRVFRLDRLNALTRTGTRYTPRSLPAESALDYLRAGIHRTSQPITLTVEAPTPRVIDALKYQDAEIEPCGDQQTRVTLWLDSWPWLIPHLAALETDFTLNAPPEFQGACNAFAQRLLAATGHTTTRSSPRTQGRQTLPSP